MMTSRLTVGILGFFAFAFCVDTTISDAQIFRGRFCNPCRPTHRYCPPRCIEICDYCKDCGMCTVRYENGEWILIAGCQDSSCRCEAPNLTNPPIPNPNNGDEKTINCDGTWPDSDRLCFHMIFETDDWNKNVYLSVIKDPKSAKEYTFYIGTRSYNWTSKHWKVHAVYNPDATDQVQLDPSANNIEPDKPTFKFGLYGYSGPTTVWLNAQQTARWRYGKWTIDVTHIN